MRKILLVVLAIVSTVALANTFTTNYNFNKPGDREKNYGSLIRDNWDTADTQIKANETSISDHLADTVDAHDASAISATAGTNLCTTQTDVQAYLTCLDGTFDPSTSGVVLIAGTQTVTGSKTFSATPKFSALSNGILSTSAGDGTIVSGTFGSVDPLTTKGDILIFDTDSDRLAVGSDGQVLVAQSSASEGIAWENANPRWRKVTLAYSDFSAASLSFAVTGLTLQAKEGIDAVVLNHTTAFSGGSITAYTVEVGLSAASTKYANAFDTFQAIGGTVRDVNNVTDVPNFSGTTDVIVTARAIGANLDQVTAGSVDIYLRTFLLP